MKGKNTKIDERNRCKQRKMKCFADEQTRDDVFENIHRKFTANFKPT